jgi:TP901 family phage tail tape measure protein
LTNVGFATLDVLPSFSQFGSLLSRSTNSAMGAAGKSGGKLFSSSFAKVVGGAGLLGAAFGIADFVKDSVQLEAEFGRTMAQIKVATQAPAGELKRLDDLAIRLGKDTIFSANDASEAMLELAKNGIKTATIEAGALQSALTLAAAGGVNMETAATVMGNALNAFNLPGKKSASVAAALAGAANASSASVDSLAQGLQQASTVAADTGFNVQETTAVIAAFANAGIAGSDAGTSLKTMLSRLVPTTTKAKDAMKKFGLEFVNADGSFKNATQIAGELKDGLGELSASERSSALNTIFGSDARRAATILVKEGADGLAKYIKATSDQGAAEEMAQANMKGTAGAIERLKGTWETAKLEFGKSIAPVVADFLDLLASKIDDVGPKLTEFGEWFTSKGVPKLKRFSGFVKNDVLPMLETLGGYAKTAAGHASDLVGAFNNMPEWAKKVVIGGGVTALAANKVLPKGAAGGALGAAKGLLGSTKPVPVFVTNKGLGGGGGAGDLLGGGGKSAAIKGVSAVSIAGSAGLVVALGAGAVIGSAIQGKRFAQDSQTPSGLNPGARVLTGRGFGSDDPDKTARAYVNLRNQYDLSDARLKLYRETVVKFNSTVDKTPRQVETLFKSKGYAARMREIELLKAAYATVGAGGVPNAGSEAAPRGFGSEAGLFAGANVNVTANTTAELAAEARKAKRRAARAGHR